MDIFFCGIGGVSMSALASICIKLGHTVSGSDMQKVKIKGAKIYHMHSADNISHTCNVFVYTDAIDKNNNELKEARRRGLKIFSRAQFLSSISRMFKNVVAVAGCHGKTTTTAMIAHIFNEAGFNPTAHIGGYANNFKNNYVIGDTDYFITEACEFKKSFLTLFADVAVITNTDTDHVDCYKNKKEIKKAYAQFASQGRKVFFGKNAPLWLSKIKFKFAGKHNYQNAYAAYRVAKYFKIDKETILTALKTFDGVGRRFEMLGKTKSGATVIQDYAHHPTEIVQTKNVAKKLGYKKNICIFQPHTYTRTAAFINEFAKALAGFTFLYIAPTYAARERPIAGASHGDLARKITGSIAGHSNTFTDIAKDVLEKSNSQTLILILGAGDINKISKKLLINT